MRRRLWLGLAWLLLARAPGAAGTPNRPRGARSYPHLEGDVRWRRLFSSTRFFLRVDAGGRVQGTRWRHGPDSIVEIRSVHVGVVVVKSVHNGFYVAMDRQGRVYGSLRPLLGQGGTHWVQVCPGGRVSALRTPHPVPPTSSPRGDDGHQHPAAWGRPSQQLK
ncbi:fibroblast growth factor 22 isoform X3 [Choloepus didactylus]|uniref:fibroblast growth factor 22 isoform X3 n=1 Tax=Choloepus didactylus TaxID=27675 RepID=UPI00189F53A6|nr:fibroblast growth factor 22 isoform X3 [Choloepus didactylus]